MQLWEREKRKVKVYISGKITGLPKRVYWRNFSKAESKLIEQGFTTVNPVRVNGQLPTDTTYEQYMEVSKVLLSFCDAIYLMFNWKDSPGAIRERDWALEMGKDIIMETHEE